MPKAPRLWGAMLLALACGVCALAPAAAAGPYRTNRAIAAKVTRATGAEASTVVGHSKRRDVAYVRSVGKQANGDGSATLYLKTRAVRRDTLAIVRTSSNHLMGTVEATQRDQVRRDGTELSASRVPVIPGNAKAGQRMTQAGHARATVLWPGAKPQRIITLSKTGAITGVRAAPDDGIAE